MSRVAKKSNKGLTQSFVDKASVGRHLDQNGLYLVVKKIDQGSWEYREQRNGVRHQIGLGSTKKVKLAIARDLAAKARCAIAEGRDPKEAIGKGKIQKTLNEWSLEVVTERYFQSVKHNLKDEGRAGRWHSPLANHIFPKLGGKSVEEITAEDIRDTLSPIWISKPDVCKKALNRLGKVIEYSCDEGSTADFGAPARAKRLLGEQPSFVTHIPHTPYEDIPALYARISALTVSPATLALRLTLLTAQRSKPVREAMCDQFDLETGVWTIPAESMKGRVGKTEAFICPISTEAKRVVQLALPFSRGGKLFPAQRGSNFVSDVALTKILNKLDEAGRVHGFRSSFADWGAASQVPFDQIEHNLQHKVGSKVSQAYRRDPQVELRRGVLTRWSEYVAQDARGAQRANFQVVK